MSADELKAKGNKAFTEGKFDESVKHFTDAINLDPKNHILYSNRSGAYASLKKYNEALADAEKTVELKSDWAKGYSRKVTALHYLGKYDEAEAAANQGLKIEPENAQLKQGLDDVKKVRSAPKDPNMMLANLFKGDAIAKLAANPETARFLAQPDFVQILGELQRDSSPATLNKYMRDPRVMNCIGVLLGIPLSAASPSDFAQEEPQPPKKEEPKKEEPKKEPKKEEKKDEPMPDVPELSEEKKAAEAEKALGNAAYTKKDFDTAVAHYTKAIEIDASAVYYTNRAAAYFEKGDFDNCIKDCESSIEEGRKHYDYKQVAKAWARMGNAYMKQNKLEDAINAYSKSLTEDRTAATLALLKKAEKLNEENDRKAYLDPVKAQEAKDRGNKFFSEGKYPEAIKEYSEAMKRNPEDHTLYSNRAACYTKLTEYQLGLKDAETCIAMKPDFAKAYSRKGSLHFFMKEYDKSIQAYEKGLELDPNNAEMTEGVKRAIAATQQSRFAKQQGGQPDQDTLNKAMNDPEIQQILSDPVMRQILQDMQNDPAAAANHLKSPLIMGKIQKLVDAGVLRVA